jgi:hypothetical protein
MHERVPAPGDLEVHRPEGGELRRMGWVKRLHPVFGGDRRGRPAHRVLVIAVAQVLVARGAGGVADVSHSGADVPIRRLER